MTQLDHHTEFDPSQPGSPEEGTNPNRRLMALLTARVQYIKWMSVANSGNPKERTRADEFSHNGWRYRIIQNGRYVDGVGDVVPYDYFQVSTKQTFNRHGDSGVFDIDEEQIELLAPLPQLLSAIGQKPAASHLIEVLEAVGENTEMLRMRVAQTQRQLQQLLGEGGILQDVSERVQVALLQHVDDPERVVGLLFTQSGLMEIEEHSRLGTTHTREMTRFSQYNDKPEFTVYLGGQKLAPEGPSVMLRRIAQTADRLYSGILYQEFVAYEPEQVRLVEFTHPTIGSVAGKVGNNQQASE